MIVSPICRRAGFGLIALLVALAIVTILMGTITAQIFINRKTADRRENQLQALWLARAGLEVAAAKLLSGTEDYRGEALELIPESTVRIEVQRQKDTFHVRSEANYSAGSPQPVVRELNRTYRRVTEGKRVRLEVVVETKTP
jgi:type II secretory pathway pseudopilin PulG